MPGGELTDAGLVRAKKETEIGITGEAIQKMDGHGDMIAYNPGEHSRGGSWGTAAEDGDKSKGVIKNG